jgi:hypothetical protein
MTCWADPSAAAKRRQAPGRAVKLHTSPRDARRRGCPGSSDERVRDPTSGLRRRRPLGAAPPHLCWRPNALAQDAELTENAGACIHELAATSAPAAGATTSGFC